MKLKIIVPTPYNYISAFLTFACQFKCHYCINKYNNLYQYEHMSVDNWIRGLNRIVTTHDRPITLTGGEPTLYKDFYKLIDWINPEINIDLLTNGSFSVEKFMEEVKPYRLKRNAPYASIRISYHPGYTDIHHLQHTAVELHKNGYSVGIWAVDTGGIPNHLIDDFEWLGIDFRTKEYLDADHGHYKYPLALDGKPKPCFCKPSEMLIAPDGRLFRCHADLYNAVNSYGHILDEDVELPDEFLPCERYGLCNPCDIKTKFNRFQQTGHCSVEIKDFQ